MRNHRILRFLGLGLVVGCLSIGPSINRLEAQVVKGSISGEVADPTGAAIPEADVRAISDATGVEYRAVSGAYGSFRIPLVAVGTYTVTITKSGFRKAVIQGVEVSSAQDTGLPSVKLEVGQVTSTVEVSAAPPLLHSSESQISATIKVATFPGVGGNEGLDVIALQVPGIVRSRGNSFSNSNGVTFSSNGLRGRNNDQQIDGQNNNDNSVAGPYLFLANGDFVDEYRIITNNFGPEYGRNSGSVVNIVTKSGGNALHGAAFVSESNSKLNTLSNVQKAFEGLTKLPVANEEFSGASAGGPIVRDKAFFFGGFDDDIQPGSAVYTFPSGITPTPAGLSQLASCFPNSTSLKVLQQYGPYGITGGSPVPSGNTTRRDITVAGSPPCLQVPFAGVQRALSTPSKQYDVLIRGDVNRIKDRIYSRFIWQKNTPLNLDSFGRAASGYPNNVPSFGEDIGLSWTRNLSSNMVNEARLSYGRLTVEFGGNGIGNTIPDQGQIDQALTNITIGGGIASFGPATNAPQGRIVNTYQFQDNWTYIRGRHQIKAGANLTYQRSPNAFLPSVNGSFAFPDFAGFVANTPSTVSVTLGNPLLDFREHDSFFYFGDDFKVKSNLTLNLGITWSYFGQPANLFNKSGLARESNASTAFWNTSLPLSIRTFPELPSSKSNWGPSVGFAYSPHWGGPWGNGKTVFRGGYRVAYDPGFYNIYLNIATAAPQVLAQTITAPSTVPPLPAQPFGPAIRSQLSSFLTLRVSDPRSFTQTTVTPDFRSDRVHSWTFGVQRQLSPQAVVEARYVGNHGTNLFQSLNLNPEIQALATLFPSVLPSGATPCPTASAVVPSATGRANCNLGIVTQRANTALSDYHALQTEFRASNLRHQLTLRTAYTWSKTTDNVSEIFSTGSASTTTAFAQNPFDFVGSEHGLSGIDIPNNWTMSFYEEIPAFRDQHGIMGHILGGWAVAGSYVLQAGQPYSPAQRNLNFRSQGLGNRCLPTSHLYDCAFVSSETARPFLSNSSAPEDSVGVYAADLCKIDGRVGCGLPATTLLSFNSYNQQSTATPTTPGAVRFIVNGLQADTAFGTPFGTAGRNTLRDAHINTGNFGVYKFIRVTERVKARFDMQMLNVFNHPSFGTVGRNDIDPFLDDAGLANENTGFANPKLFSGGNLNGTGGMRQIKFGLRVTF